MYRKRRTPAYKKWVKIIISDMLATMLVIVIGIVLVYISCFINI